MASLIKKRENSLMMYVVLWLLHLTAVASCSLCGDAGMDSLFHPNDFVDPYGKRCAQLAVELSRVMDPGVCIRWIKSSRVRCCTRGGHPPITQEPIAPQKYDVDGPYNRCPICVGGGAPSAVGMVINVLYMGPGTCNQYYEWGQRGWIKNHLCSAIQYFAREPCGC